MMIADWQLKSTKSDAIVMAILIIYVSCASLNSSLNIRKGSRTGNSGNNLEFTVLTLLKSVP